MSTPTRDKPKARGPLDWGRSWFHHADAAMSRCFGERYNLFYALGAIPVFLMFVLLFTGLYLFIYYRLAVDMTYDSVKYMTERAPLGGFIRALHRYAADAMMFFVILHMVRMLVEGKFQNHRWLAWVSGVVLWCLLIFEGVIGYAMPLDTTSQFILNQTADLLSAVGVFGDTLPRAFAMPTLMGKWIMWILLIMHLGIPLSFLGLLYLHVKRVSRAKIFPNRGLMLAMTAALMGFATLFPAVMQAPADPGRLPVLERVDWFYLFMAPFVKQASPGGVALGFLAVMLMLSGIPWMRKRPRLDQADLDLPNCTGCGACALDCPYEAIHMQARTDGAKYRQEAHILKNLCAGCGICVGSCDFGGMHLTALRLPVIVDQIRAAVGQGDGRTWLAVFCQGQLEAAPKLSKALGEMPQVAPLVFPCAGLVGPTFVEEARCAGAAGVVAATCASGDCHYREGNRWLEERVLGKRKPRFKRAQKDFPVALLRFNPTQWPALLKSLSAFVERPREIAAARRWLTYVKEGRPFFHYSLATLILAGMFWFFYLTAVRPLSRPATPDYALVRVDFFYQTQPRSDKSTGLSEAEIDKEIQRLSGFVHQDQIDDQSRARLRRVAEENVRRHYATRARNPLEVILVQNGGPVLTRVYQPVGVHRDGLVHVYQKWKVSAGSHRLVLTAREQAPGETKLISTFELNQNFEAGRVYFIDYSESDYQFYLRER